MKKFKSYFFLSAVLIVIIYSNCFAGNHTVSATVEITSTAINRYLNTQYNSTGFPRSVNVNYNNTSYTISLSLPQIILTPNNAKIKMVFDVNTATSNVYHFEVDPSIDIPSDQITLAQIQAYLTDLSTVLNNITFLPSWVRTDVMQYYNSLGFVVFPSKLIDQVNSTWFADRSINLTSPYFALGWQVGQGTLDFIVSTYLDAQAPIFSATIDAENNNHNHFKSGANINETLNQIQIWNVSFTTEYCNISPTLAFTKGSQIDYDLGALGLKNDEIVIVNVLYTTDNTWYSRQYKIAVGAGYVLPQESEN